MTKVGAIEYRGRKFSKYWLSDRGIAFALLNGANPEKIKSMALSFDGDETYFELRSLSPKIANILDTAILLSGMISPEELVKLLILEVAPMEKAEIKKFLDTVKESGKFEGALNRNMEYMRKFMNEIGKT